MRQFNKLLLTAILLMMSAFMSHADNFSDGDFTYTTGYQYNSMKGVYLTGLTDQGKSKTQLNIPSTVKYNGDTYRVMEIRANAFAGQTKLIIVKFYYGVHSIGQNAFNGCTKLEYVYLPSSINEIIANAFNGCTSLKYVYYAGFNFPTRCDYSAFPNNANMNLYISPQSTPSEAEYQDRTGFTQFANVTKSKKACDIPMSDGGCYSVGAKDYELPLHMRELTMVGYDSGASGTQSGTVYSPSAGDNFTMDGMRYTVTKIGKNAFSGASNVKTIDMTYMNNLTYFDFQAFADCSAVTRMVLPKSDFNFHPGAFNGLSSLTDFEIPSGSVKKVCDGSLYSSDYHWLLRVPEGKTGIMTYHPDLKGLEIYSHYNCKKITGAMLPYGVRTIEDQAFYGTSALESVRIPSSVTFLDTYYVFMGTNSNLTIYCNMDNPPTVPTGYFGTYGDNSSMKLFIPYGKEDTYRNAGWTGFASVNEKGKQAFDIGNTSTLCYTVTKDGATTVNGTAYDACVKLVCQGYTASNNSTSINVPADFTQNGKKYAVTGIGGAAFRNHTSNFPVSGCANVDSIHPYAFQNQAVTSYLFTHNLVYIGNYAFSGTNLTGTVAIPYGVKLIGPKAFANGKYERLIVPKTCSSYGDFAYNTTTLKELVYNRTDPNYSGWNLTNVPADCSIRVPVGTVDNYRQGKLSDRADYITSGAYDFAMSNSYNGNYMVSILSTTPVTFNGTTYAGTAKYVHTPNVTGRNFGGWLDAVTDKTVSTDQRAYLITEIGDSLLVGSKVDRINIPAAVKKIGDYAYAYISPLVTSNLVLPEGLTNIGKLAFYGTNLSGEIKIPASVTTIGEGAFGFMGSLNSLYFPGAKPSSLGDCVWTPNGINHSLNVWVPNEYANDYLTTANEWGEPWGQQLSVWFKPSTDKVMFSTVVATAPTLSGVVPYIATAYDKSNPTQQLTLTMVGKAAANTGLLLTGCTANQELRIKHATGSVSAPATNYFVGTPTADVRVDEQTVGYYWSNSETPHFIKATSAYTSTVGQAYLKLRSSEASGINEVYTNLWPKELEILRGDVDNSGAVDVDDMNIVINIILGKADAADYPGQADVDGSGTVDIDDMNIIINIILGKS